MNSLTQKDYNPQIEAEDSLCRAIRAIEEGMAAIRCHAHIFDEGYPNVFWDLDQILRYLDKFQFTEE